MSGVLKRNNQITSLVLSNCLIGNVGAMRLGGAIGQHSSFTSIDLSRNPDINDEGWKAFATGIRDSVALETCWCARDIRPSIPCSLFPTTMETSCICLSLPHSTLSRLASMLSIHSHPLSCSQQVACASRNAQSRGSTAPQEASWHAWPLKKLASWHDAPSCASILRYILVALIGDS